MNDTIDLQAERLLRRSADALTTPRAGECLCCFVVRMLDDYGCDCTLRFAKRYRDLAAPRASALERRLGQMGGFCDCEIFLNGMRPGDHLCTYDEDGEGTGATVPVTCAGVRKGSTQPCRHWVRRRGMWD